MFLLDTERRVTIQVLLRNYNRRGIPMTGLCPAVPSVTKKISLRQ